MKVIGMKKASEIAMRERKIDPCGSLIGIPTWWDQYTVTTAKAATSTQTRTSHQEPVSSSPTATEPARVGSSEVVTRAA